MPKASACGNKKKLVSKAAALGHLLWLIRHGARVDGMDVYLCARCNCWHVGRPPRDR